MHTSCNPVFPGRQVQLTSTSKPVTPFGGLVSLIAFFERIGLAGQISGLMPFVHTKAAATNSMAVITGVEGHYDAGRAAYLPPPPYRTWGEVVGELGLRL